MLTSDWIERLLSTDSLASMGHAQRTRDANLGLGWLYYGLARIIRQRTAVVIGSYRGFAPMMVARALMDNDEQGEVHFIDPSLVDDFWTRPTEVSEYFATFGITNIKHHRMTTQAFVESETYASLRDVGLVFIDGYHTYQQAQFDFDSFEKKLHNRGIVLLHDSSWLTMSDIYGPGRSYVHQVRLLVEDLRSRADLQVLNLPFGDGVALVTRQVGPALTTERGDTGIRALREVTDRFNASDGRSTGTAVECLDAYLATHERAGAVWMLRGSLLARTGEWQAAISSFEQAKVLGCPDAGQALLECRRHRDQSARVSGGKA